MSWARITGDAAGATLDPGAATPSLELQFAADGAPLVRWVLAGAVTEDSARSSGRELAFGLRPFPEAALAGHGTLELEVRVALDAAQGGVTPTVDGSADYPIDRLAVPGDLRLAGGRTADWRFLLPLGEGISLPASQAALAEAPRALPSRSICSGAGSRSRSSD